MNGDSPEPSDETLRFVATYAAGIGPNIKLFYVDGIMGADASFNTLAQRARDHGLLLMPYTFKREDLPSGMTLEALIQRFVFELGVDALMTDFPDVALEVIQEK